MANRIPQLHRRNEGGELYRLIQRYFESFFEAGRREEIIRKNISTRLMIEILLGAMNRS